MNFVEVSLNGTRWPIPASWKKLGEGKFGDENGLLNLMQSEGELLDPGRCATAKSLRPGVWTLADSTNGTMVCGRYGQTGADVMVFLARGDMPPDQGMLFPEVQAIYVLREPSGNISERLTELLRLRTVDVGQLGRLDAAGHIAMGPVPIPTRWIPSEARDAMTSGERAQASVPMLVGGGVVTFTDRSQRNGLILEPLPLRVFSTERAMELLKHSIRDSKAQTSQGGAAVWQWPIAESGCSYAAHLTPTGEYSVGAAWADAVGQSWHLRYWFDAKESPDVALLSQAVVAQTRN